mmetsp:Transcript_21041/g.18667  ORF Transcript_21041/g.18667 Transcript_21041/m.18667 type:complete len:100 (+) Transcript_21041:7-306(+)
MEYFEANLLEEEKKMDNMLFNNANKYFITYGLEIETIIIYYSIYQCRRNLDSFNKLKMREWSFSSMNLDSLPKFRRKKINDFLSSSFPMKLDHFQFFPS